jgi:hypothetical protein
MIAKTGGAMPASQIIGWTKQATRGQLRTLAVIEFAAAALSRLEPSDRPRLGIASEVRRRDKAEAVPADLNPDRLETLLRVFRADEFILGAQRLWHLPTKRAETDAGGDLEDL